MKTAVRTNTCLHALGLERYITRQMGRDESKIKLRKLATSVCAPQRSSSARLPRRVSIAQKFDSRCLELTTPIFCVFLVLHIYHATCMLQNRCGSSPLPRRVRGEPYKVFVCLLHVAENFSVFISHDATF
jgi:hypothetical protein